MPVRHPLRAVIGLALSLGVLVLAACTSDAHQTTFDPAGPVARMQQDLFIIVLWAAVFVFVVVEAALIYILVRYRRRARNSLIPQTHGNTRLEIAWTIAPAIILLIIAVPTIITLFAVANPKTEPELEINVTGHQWWWEFEYPKQGIVTANEMHIPRDTVVKLNLRSDDVLHSFWVPKLAGKVDLIPGRTNTMWIESEREESFLGQCAEFCGEAHALMRFRVIAQSQEDFEAWTLALKRPASPSQDGEAAVGAELFSQKGCIACHTIEGTIAQGRLGPILTHFGSRTTMAAGIMENNSRNLAQWLRDPQKIKPGNKMILPQELSDAEIGALIVYLQSLK